MSSKLQKVNDIPIFTFIKQPYEEMTKAVNFSKTAEIKNGEIIETATVTVTEKGNVVDGILVGYDIEDALVKFRVKDGEDKKNYNITVKMVTNQGHKREADIIMYVREV